MVHAKNYETVSTFVKVMQKKPWPLFSGHGVDRSKTFNGHITNVYAQSTKNRKKLSINVTRTNCQQCK